MPLSGAQSFWQGGCVQFVQAVNSSRIILSEMKSLGTVDAAFDMKRSERLRRFGVVLGPEQDAFTVSCSLSHRRVWEYMVQNGIKQAIVLEEDAVPTSSMSLPKCSSTTRHLSGLCQSRSLLGLLLVR